MPRILPSWMHATTIIDPRNQRPTGLVEPASLLVVDAIVQELEEGVDYAAKRHPSSRTTAGRESVIRLASPSLI